jgi:DNA-binding NtrC family response regulator
MTIIDKFTEGEIIVPPNNSTGISLRTKLLFTLIPSIILVLMITGYITYLTSSHFLNQALERSARIQVKAISHEVESVLARCREDLLFIARNFSDTEKLRKNLADFIELERVDYREVGFISQKDKSHTYFISKDSQAIKLESDLISDINPSPLLYLNHLARLNHGEVWVSSITEVEYPFPTSSSPNQKIRSKVIYFGTPYISENGKQTGFILLSMDARSIRNILSLFNSPKSPLWAFPRTPEVRFAYFFDLDGWILFQSEDLEKKEMDFTTDLARMDYSVGTLGKPGLTSAFRPGSQFQPFWKMVNDVKEAKYDLINLTGKSTVGSEMINYYLAYSPVTFEEKVIAGIAYIDRTRFTLAAGYKHLDIMFILSIITIILVSFIIFLLSHFTTKPIYKLAEAVTNIQKNKKFEPINIHTIGYETNLLQHAINSMMNVLNAQVAEIKKKDQKIQHVQFKEKIELESQFPKVKHEQSTDQLTEIVGLGPRIEQFKSDILKAANVDVDVLIIGETGTGKQLAAEAIHRHSRRGNNPFISINCGELAENLLLDSLFGHVKGAFTEAKTDRKGAFLEANGGTLFLDEIQTASPAVQQALLRAVAMRKIKPLGTDKEYDVDVRLICATNIDLRILIETQQFRSDLYYRLKVITIYTPALREHKENIPVLINHYILQLQESTRREGLGISKGALEKMKQYAWPGNVRELMNCITRAAVMAENHIIQADDVLLDSELINYSDLKIIDDAAQEDPDKIPQFTEDDDVYIFHPGVIDPEKFTSANKNIQMNSRQEKVLSFIRANKTITRNQYQSQVGDNISARTAIYDLQDLVKKGVLQKEGSGPATRYILIERESLDKL